MQVSLVHRHFYDAPRKGNTGRLEKGVTFSAAMFHSVPRHANYCRLTIDLLAKMRVKWTPEMREIWLKNALVNMSGKLDKFIVIDAFNEYVARVSKDVYNNAGFLQSTKHTC